MAHAYTPGLRVADRTTLVRERRLPLKGTVVVAKGQQVRAEDVVARTELPGNVQTVNLANLLGVPPSDVAETLVVPIGGAVAAGQPIAQTKSMFGLFKSKATAPTAGTLENVSTVTGQAIVREPPIPVEVEAYVDGTVVDVISGEGAVIETEATFIQGIFGIGGEVFGELAVAVSGPHDTLSEQHITPALKGKIVVGGAYSTTPVLKKAIDAGVRAVVLGGFDAQALKDFLGYDLGVAITGSEDKGITLVLTEGFGSLRMAEGTFRLLKSREGARASVSGATQIRAGVMRPEIVVPIGTGSAAAATDGGESAQILGLAAGVPIRGIREPYFGRLGTVVSLPHELRPLDTEAKVRVVEVEWEGGERVVVPRANVELIEA
jgi:hypothetical protein